MNMTGKQRAALRGMASVTEPIFQIGKGGVSQALLDGLDGALEKRELIKITVLRNCEKKAKELIGELAEALNAEPVTAVGNKIVLYRRSKNDKIQHIEF
ncbi:MAG: ribosome assembly RNA-binding protein YhbY [Candidatus Neoclostridium sp.]